MKILLVGISVRAMAESAVHSGYQVIALDAFGDLDLEAIAECHALQREFHLPFSAGSLYKASQGLTFEAVAYTSNLENHPRLIDKFSQRYLVLGNPSGVIRRIRHWQTLIPVLARAGYSVPETVFPGKGSFFDPARSWLIKPVLSGGGHGVAYWKRKKLPGQAYMLQEYVPGRPCSFSFVANGSSCVMIGMTEQLIGGSEFNAGGFLYCGNLLPIGTTREEADRRVLLGQARKLAAYLTQEYALVGLNTVDFILHDSQIFLTEVNPRYSASMELIEWAYGLPVFKLHVQAVLTGELPDFELETKLDDRSSYGKAILYAHQDATAPDTLAWHERGIRDIPHPGERLVRGTPICTLLAEGKDRESCLAGLIDKSKRIQGVIYA
ncbi:MAG TPA: ATP-grasp domain-containing protein [Anaerolineaceae bacterium]|nr:ATP-grasp domain-containing protein [Anaerolineaceae bacterium]